MFETLYPELVRTYVLVLLATNGGNAQAMTAIPTPYLTKTLCVEAGELWKKRSTFNDYYCNLHTKVK